VKWYNSSLAATSRNEVDLNDDLGVPAHENVFEHTVRYQFRPNWAIHYSLLHFDARGHNITGTSFNFGQWNFPVGSDVSTRLEFNYHRIGLLYQAINTPELLVSVFNYWVYNDQRLQVNSDICNGRGNTLDRTRWMIMSGLELQRCIHTSYNLSTLSWDNRIGFGYLDDTFIIDLQLGLQYTVPLNCGRWGYVKAGWRFIDFNESQDRLKYHMALEGGFIGLGMIF
jgi:hypothetical protein